MPESKIGNILSAVTAVAMIIASSLALSSCNKDDDDNTTVGTETWEVMAVMSPSSIGDLAYGDKTFYGVCQLRDSLGCKVTTYCPYYADEVEKVAKAWLDQGAKDNQHRLLILCDGAYADIVRSNGWKNTKNNDILLLDSGDDSIPVYTRNLMLYGVCYYCGRMSAEVNSRTGKHIALIEANDMDWSVKEGAEGFVDGNKDAGVDVDVYNVCDDLSRGYDQSDSIYHLCYDIASTTGFVLPLAGPSNQGVYRYGRDSHSDVLLTCSVDEYNFYETSYTCFTINRNISKYLIDFVSEWKSGNTVQMHSSAGLESGYVKLYSTALAFSKGLGQNYQSALDDAVRKEKRVKRLE